MKTVKEIIKEERITIPTSLAVARRLQRWNISRSVEFDFDEKSMELLVSVLPFENATYDFLKRFAEKLIVAHREKHRKTDISRLNLMERGVYRSYRSESFYYSKED